VSEALSPKAEKLLEQVVALKGAVYRRVRYGSHSVARTWDRPPSVWPCGPRANRQEVCGDSGSNVRPSFLKGHAEGHEAGQRSLVRPRPFASSRSYAVGWFLCTDYRCVHKNHNIRWNTTILRAFVGRVDQPDAGIARV